jgi:hypothetical protein
MSCPKPLAHKSVRYCEKHLTAQRLRHKPIGSVAPGSIDYLYLKDKSESRHGRQPEALQPRQWDARRQVAQSSRRRSQPQSDERSPDAE